MTQPAQASLGKKTTVQLHLLPNSDTPSFDTHSVHMYVGTLHILHILPTLPTYLLDMCMGMVLAIHEASLGAMPYSALPLIHN